MTRRMWQWTAVLTVAAAVLLALAGHGVADWHRSSTGPEVTSIGPVLGFIFGGVLLLAAGTIVGVAWRRRREQRRYERRVAAARAEYDGHR